MVAHCSFALVLLFWVLARRAPHLNVRKTLLVGVLGKQPCRRNFGYRPHRVYRVYQRGGTPFGRRAPHRINVHVHPRQPNSRFCLGACNSWERATNACNPQDPRPAINPTGRARLEQASKRAIESSRAGEASASATGPRQLACMSQANEPTQLRLNYERRTSTLNSVFRPLLDFFANLCDLSFLGLPANDVRG